MKLSSIKKFLTVAILCIGISSFGQSIFGTSDYCIGTNNTYYTTAGCNFKYWYFTGTNGATMTYQNGTSSTSQFISVSFSGSGSLTAQYECTQASIPINTSAGPASVSVTASPTQVTAGQSVTLNATGASYYTWSGPGVPAQATGSQITATPTTAGPTAYYAYGTLTQGASCSTQGSVLVTVLQGADAGPDRTYCKEVGSISLADWGANLTTGSWSGPAISNNTIDLSQLAQGDYTYTYTRTSDNSSDAMVMTVLQSVSGSLSLQTTSTCGTLTGTLSITGSQGSILYWERSYDNGVNWTQINSQSSTYSYSETQTTAFRASVRKGSCSIAVTPAVVISPVNPVAGSISASNMSTGCDLITGTLTVTGSNGDVKFWQRSYDDGNVWSNIPNSAASTLTGISETQKVQYRAGSQKDNCAVVYTDPYTLTPVHPVGGFLSASSLQIACANTTGTLALQNYSGDKLTWQTTSDGNTWNDILNSGDTYALAATVDASFRVKVEWQNSTCAPQYSTVYFVSTTSKGGTSSTNNPTVQCGTATGDIYLSGFVGSIVQWENSTDGVNWQTEANSAGKMPLQYSTTNPLTYYRALIQLGSCSAQYSTAVSVSASSPTVPGKVKFLREDPITINSDGSYTFHPVFQLQGYTGQIQNWWQYETINSNTQSSIYPATTEIIKPAIVQTTGFRADVKNGGCDPLLSGQSTFIINAPFLGIFRAVQPLTLNSYAGQSISVANPGGVSLQQGFSFVANSGQSFSIMQDDNYVLPPSDKNFVLQEKILKEGITNESDIYFLNATERASTFAYSDGLGRQVQEVQRRVSPDERDMVVPITYDALGRQDKNYLPYVANSTNGAFQKTAVIDQASFYHAPPEKTTSSDFPFSAKVYEASPLNRVLEQGAPGTDWQPGIGHAVKYEYLVNDINEVRFWSIDGTTQHPLISSYYAAGDLSVLSTIDENNNKVKVYTDKQGFVILKRTQNGADWHDTYYIYDDFGLKRFVIQPEGTARLSSTPTGNTLDDDFLSKWTFQYLYDYRSRQVAKRVPGSDWVYMVYDSRDRLVMSQDGNQRIKNQWGFIKYDYLNRPVMTGIYTYQDQADPAHIANRDEINNLISTTSFSEAFDGSSPYGYTVSNTFPSDHIEPLTVTYYDNYNFTSLLNGFEYDAGAISGLPDQPSIAVKGQVTGTQTKVLNKNTWLKSVVWYDKRYRSIQTTSTNHLGGLDRVSRLYDFAGKVLVKATTHIKDQTTSAVTITEEYNYDHAGRLLAQYYQLGNGPKVNLKTQYYNVISQLVEKNLHLKDDGTYQQSVDFRYNERGWLTHINNATLTNDGGVTNDDGNDYFGFELKYNNPSAVGGVSQFNGNISETQWSTAGSSKQSYSYTYDPLNRLLKAKYLDWGNPSYNNTFNETITQYDLNGNIKGLQRGATGSLTDDLAHVYSGNQLISVTETNQGDKTKGFVDGDNTDDDYAFDANGNMVQDQNKGIGTITYNYLNLPESITKSQTDNVQYLYTASGSKISQISTENNQPKTTDYIGNFVYEDGILQFILTDEGRVNVANGNAYEYFLKDHVGNVRTTFSTVRQTESHTATMEIDSDEDSYFLNFGNTRISTIPQINHTPASPSDVIPPNKVSRLNGSYANLQQGPAKSIAVFPGDKIKAQVYVKYLDLRRDNGISPSSLANILAGTLANFTTSIDGNVFRIVNNSDPTIAAILDDGSDPSYLPPNAFLTCHIFDKYHNPVSYISKKVDESAVINPSTIQTHQDHQLLEIEVEITQPGFVYVNLSHEANENIDVYFDDFTVEHQKGFIVQQQDFFPFGMEFNSLTQDGLTEQNFSFNGNEKQKLTGWLDFGERMYDAIIARTSTLDPSGDEYDDVSSYSFLGNNPVNIIDPTGADNQDVASEWELGNEWSEGEFRFESIENNEFEWTNGGGGDDKKKDDEEAKKLCPECRILQGVTITAQRISPPIPINWTIPTVVIVPTVAVTTILTAIFTLIPTEAGAGEAELLRQMQAERDEAFRKKIQLNSKGGKKNIWPDQYGYPPDPKKVDWTKSDSQLADELSNESGDSDRGPGSANNMAKKWFRDKRP